MPVLEPVEIIPVQTQPMKVTKAKIDALKKIEYQLMKNSERTPTDQQRVDMAQSLLDHIVGEGDIVIDNMMPASLFGTDLDWAAGSANDTIVSISLNGVTEEHDLADDPELTPLIFNPEESMTPTIGDSPI